MIYAAPRAEDALTFDECEEAGVDGTLRFFSHLRTSDVPVPNPTVSFSDEIYAEDIVGYFLEYGVRVTLLEDCPVGAKEVDGHLAAIEQEWPYEVLVIKDFERIGVKYRVPWTWVADIHIF